MLPLIVLAAFIAVWTALSERARRKLAERVRADWGSPHVQDRRMDAIAEYYRSRAGSVPGRTSLDDRTWNDLDMDQVFAAVDRTESTLGQQALYHRLRSAPVADNIDAFELLVNRITPPTTSKIRSARRDCRSNSGCDPVRQRRETPSNSCA